MSHKASLACAGAIAAAATLAGIGPALSHTIVGNRVFPATLAIDDPGVNDEFALPTFSYFPNPDNSNEYDFNVFWQKTITYNLSFSIADTFTHQRFCHSRVRAPRRGRRPHIMRGEHDRAVAVAANHLALPRATGRGIPIRQFGHNHCQVSVSVPCEHDDHATRPPSSFFSPRATIIKASSGRGR
jgi:hypothetical protein